jgi:hypothetical protein
MRITNDGDRSNCCILNPSKSRFPLVHIAHSVDLASKSFQHHIEYSTDSAKFIGFAARVMRVSSTYGSPEFVVLHTVYRYTRINGRFDHEP